MTANLDLLLEPGETILYRTKGRRHAATAIIIALNPACLLFCIYLGDYTSDPANLTAREIALYMAMNAAILLCVFGVFALTAWLIQHKGPDDLLITERRLLFANGDWDDKFETIALADIESIYWEMNTGMRRLTIRGRARMIQLTPLRDINGAARALARASGKPAPPALGPLLAIDPIHAYFPLGFLFAYIVIRYGLGWGDGIASALEMDPLAVSTSAIVLVIDLSLSFVAGIGIMTVLMSAVLRLKADADFAEMLLCAGKKDHWMLSLQLWFVGLLFDRKLTYRPN